MRILVTGASGFLGWQVVNQLSKTDNEIHASSRHCPDDFPANITFHAADLLADGAAAELIEKVGPTHLLHLAWDARPNKFWNSSENLDWVAASLKLYRAFAAFGGRRAVFAGSCAEYIWSSSTLSERTTPLDPATLYGASKDALRRIIEKSSAQDKISFAWGRLFWLYGPREQPGRLISDLIASLLAGKEFACSKGTQRRDFMHVEDASEAFVRLLMSDFEGAINIASGQAIQVSDIIRRGADLAGNPELVQFGALPSKEGEPAELVASVDLLHDVLRFKQKYLLDEGLGNTISWWKSRETN